LLATLVIGLREGLEAALIVGMLAAFLRRNNASLRPMWIGVVAAIVLSLGVGVALELVSASLPERAQEGMETVVSAVALVFVTTMIVWMSSHARGLKKELEASAGDALHQGTTWAIAGMAFLAIIKEGFETSVFLLATFQNSTSVVAAASGALLGIAISVGIGIGIYHGGIRFNLGRFFQVTGVFLVLVAAGLVMSALRTAHEAQWLTIGQGKVADLSWLAPNGSVQAALLVGVLGIRPDPRVVEVLGWALYVIPLLAFTLWPMNRRLKGAQVPRLQLRLAAGLAVVGIGLAVGVPTAASAAPGREMAIVGGNGQVVGTAQLDGHALVAASTDGTSRRLSLGGPIAERHAGVDATRWTWRPTAADLPATLDLSTLASLNGGRLPVGFDRQSPNGPYDARWTVTGSGEAWTADGRLIDATQTGKEVVTLSGGSMSPRTVTLDGASSSFAALAGDWKVSPAAASAAAHEVAAADRAAADRTLFKAWLPLVLLVAAAALAATGLRRRRALRAGAVPSSAPATAHAGALAADA
jgi:high-affinity iron transporter